MRHPRCHKMKVFRWVFKTAMEKGFYRDALYSIRAHLHLFPNGSGWKQRKSMVNYISIKLNNKSFNWCALHLHDLQLVAKNIFIFLFSLQATLWTNHFTICRETLDATLIIKYVFVIVTAKIINSETPLCLWVVEPGTLLWCWSSLLTVFSVLWNKYEMDAMNSGLLFITVENIHTTQAVH